MPVTQFNVKKFFVYENSDDLELIRVGSMVTEGGDLRVKLAVFGRLMGHGLADMLGVPATDVRSSAYGEITLLNATIPASNPASFDIEPLDALHNSINALLDMIKAWQAGVMQQQSESPESQ